jgi:phosphonopyruvate decarboxylase
MINAKELVSILKKKKITFFCGVPDSVLKNFIKVLENDKKLTHYITVNEGAAISMAIGHHLNTNELSCVYLQNSGLGNAINPLISIAHKKVYSIPLIMVIGWRGAPGQKDEPQHEAKGEITPDLLKLLGIRHITINKKDDLLKVQVAVERVKKENSMLAILLKNKTIKSLNSQKKVILKKKNLLARSKFIESLLRNIDKDSKIISTTGYTSRELMQIRKLKNFQNGFDFYMVGGMGYASSVALGASLRKKKIICLDGDGSTLMHLGSLASNGFFGKKNFKHIMLNNDSHESVGGFKTRAKNINFKNLVISLNYKNYFKITSSRNYINILNKFLKSPGPSFLEVSIKEGVIENLERPKDLLKIKKEFMQK